MYYRKQKIPRICNGSKWDSGYVSNIEVTFECIILIEYLFVDRFGEKTSGTVVDGSGSMWRFFLL